MRVICLFIGFLGLFSVIFALPAEYGVRTLDGYEYPGKVKFVNSPVRGFHLELNETEKFSRESIWSYYNEDGYFLRINRNSETSGFAKLIDDRKLKLYSSETLTVDGFRAKHSLSITDSVKYFSKDYDILTRFRVSELQIALSDNPESMKYLKEYQKRERISIIGSVLGVGLVAVGCVKGIQKKNYNYFYYSGAIYLGVNLLTRGKYQYISKAVEAYNK